MAPKLPNKSGCEERTYSKDQVHKIHLGNVSAHPYIYKYIIRGLVGVEYNRRVILAEKIKHGAEDDASNHQYIPNTIFKP